MKTHLLFACIGIILVAFTFNYASSEEIELHEKPFAVDVVDLTSSQHPWVDKSHHRGTKKLPAGGYLAFKEKAPFSLWYSIYSRGNDIDILVMKDKDYKSWSHNPNINPKYIDRFSHLRVKDKEASTATVLDDEPYWIVIYNNKNYMNHRTNIDYDIRFQDTSKGLEVWVVVLLCVGLALLLGVCLVGSLFYGMRSHGYSYADREWGAGHRSQTEGYQNKTTWKVSASKGVHDPERQPLNQ